MASRSSNVLRAFTRSSPARSWSRVPTHLRCLATAAAEASHTSASPATSNDPFINRVVDDISSLTLLQAADLVTLLKSRLNIQEIALPTASAVPATAAAAAAEEPAAEKAQEKTMFNVKLESFGAAAKPKIIKEVKSLVPNLTLIEAKKFVESVPKILKENLPKEEAEKLQKVFQDLGGVVKLE